MTNKRWLVTLVLLCGCAVSPLAATRAAALLVPSPMGSTAMQVAAPGAAAATDEELREVSDAIRDRIAALPRRPCMLSVGWRRYTTLMEDILSRLTDESDAVERQHALFVLGEIDRFVTLFGELSAEACADSDAAAEAERTGQRHLQQARQRLLLVANAIRGDEFPFARFREFQKFYKNVNWNGHASSTDLLRMWNLTTNLQQIHHLVLRYTSVNGGQVRVTLPRGQQKVWKRFTKGPWVPIFGDSLERNWLYWSVSEFISGWQLQTVRFSRNCARKNSAYHCYGSTLRKLEAGQGRYRLSTMVSRQMQSALQAHVTAACKRTVANQEAMRDLILEHRPEDKQVRQAYNGAAEQFLSEIGLVARSGEAKLCSVSKFMVNLLDVAAADWFRTLGPHVVLTEVYERFRVRFQRVLDIAGSRILDGYTPPFGAVAAAAPPRLGTTREVVEANAVARVSVFSHAAHAAAQATLGFAAHRGDGAGRGRHGRGHCGAPVGSRCRAGRWRACRCCCRCCCRGGPRPCDRRCRHAGKPRRPCDLVRGPRVKRPKAAFFLAPGYGVTDAKEQ